MVSDRYGGMMRDAVGTGKAWISSITKRARPGEQVDIPLAHKDALFVRSHYDGMTPCTRRSTGGRDLYHLRSLIGNAQSA